MACNSFQTIFDGITLMQIYLVMIEEMLAQMCSNLNTQYLQRVKKWPPLISVHYLINKDSHCVENWSCKGNFQGFMFR